MIDISPTVRWIASCHFQQRRYILLFLISQPAKPHSLLVFPKVPGPRHLIRWRKNTCNNYSSDLETDSANTPPIRCLFPWERDLAGFPPPGAWLPDDTDAHWLGRGGVSHPCRLRVSDLLWHLMAAGFRSHTVCFPPPSVNKVPHAHSIRPNVGSNCGHHSECHHLPLGPTLPSLKQAKPNTCTFLWSCTPWFPGAYQAHSLNVL